MSADTLRERYEAVPYRHGATSESHPGRIGAIARLFGVEAAPPDRCRVLELGCAEGMNLLPLAERFPSSEFVGLDFSTPQIAVAEAVRAACGIGNARFMCADLRTWEPAGAFDYIIAHGLYSWVPEEVRDRLLALCAGALAPQGVAFVCYNTLPGWGLLNGFRRFLLSEIATQASPEAKMAHVARVLGALADSLKGQPGAYAASMREMIADLRAKAPKLLFHDEMAEINEPVTFAEFSGHAARHGLYYVGEAHYATMHAAHLPAAMTSALAPLQADFARTQQLLDVVFQRWIRHSLLSRAPVAPEHTLHPGAMAGGALGLRLTVDEASLRLAPGLPMQFKGIHGLVIETREPVEKAALTVLARSFPDRLPFPRLCARAGQLLSEAGWPAAGDFSALPEFLHRLFALDALDVILCGEGEWLKTSETPALSPLMRYQAENDLPLTNRWHEPLELTPEGRRVLIDPAAQPDPAVLRRAGLLV